MVEEEEERRGEDGVVLCDISRRRSLVLRPGKVINGREEKEEKEEEERTCISHVEATCSLR